jgi:hypothetical protein
LVESEDGLVKGNAGREGLADDVVIFSDELGTESETANVLSDE